MGKGAQASGPAEPALCISEQCPVLYGVGGVNGAVSPTRSLRAVWVGVLGVLEGRSAGDW